MLEVPKALLPFIGTVERIQMDNQQAIDFAYLAGLLEGEGSFTLTKHVINKRRNFKPVISMPNTDPLLIAETARIFRKYGIHYHTFNYKGRTDKHKDIWILQVIRMNSIKQLIELLQPFLIGIKQGKASLLLDFLNHRLQYGGKGKKLDESFLDNDEVIFDAIQQASETTREIPSILLEGNDIVRPSDESGS